MKKVILLGFICLLAGFGVFAQQEKVVGVWKQYLDEENEDPTVVDDEIILIYASGDFISRDSKRGEINFKYELVGEKFIITFKDLQTGELKNAVRNFKITEKGLGFKNLRHGYVWYKKMDMELPKLKKE